MALPFDATLKEILGQSLGDLRNAFGFAGRLNRSFH